MAVMLTTSVTLLLAFLGAGFFIVVATIGIALVLGTIPAFSSQPMWDSYPLVSWPAHTGFIALAVPLFILMGETLNRGGIAAPMYHALGAVFRRFPGGLLHTNIAACSLFAAVSGSSAATAVTIGSVALPIFEKAGYNKRLVFGSLAAGGTLGVLIPPSINFLLYGLFTNNSIGQLFIAGVFPGAMLALLFMAFIGFASIWHPAIAVKAKDSAIRFTIVDLVRVIPMFSLILIVLGTIYGGIATPSEAAALGVVGSFFFVAITRGRRFNHILFAEIIIATMRSTGMVLLILIGGLILNFTLQFTGIAAVVASAVAGLPFPPVATFGMITLLYLVLGMIMEPISMMVTTLFIVYPIVISLGFDPIWFGVMMVIFMEAGMLTPPVGVILFMIQGIRRDRGPLTDVIVGAMPFFLCQLLGLGLLIAFPAIATWLPRQMVSG